NAGDFSLVTTGVSGASIASVTPVGSSNGAQYTITVNTGTGEGTIAVDFAATGIQDLAGNPLPGGAHSPTYTHGVSPFHRVTGWDSTWHPIATGDFNHDGTTDVIWDNGNGVEGGWLMSDGTIAGTLQ